MSAFKLPIVVLPAFLLHFAFTGFRVDLSLSALSLQASPVTVGFIMSMLAMLPMALAFSAGRLLDNIGVRKVMLIAACTMIAGLALVFAVHRLEALFIASSLVGAGFMLFHIAVNYATGMNEQPEERLRNFSVIALTYSVSGVLGPLLTGFAIDWIGHQRTFAVLAGSALTAVILLLVNKTAVPQRAPAEDRGMERPFTELLQNPPIRRIFIVSGATSMAWDLFNFIIPIHCTSIGLSASDIGIILGAFGMGIFLIRLALPLFIHLVNEWLMLTTSTIATATIFIVFPLWHMIPEMIVFAVMLGIALGGMHPIIMSLLYKHAPPGYGGEVAGISALLLNLSQAGVPLLFGAVITGLSMTPAFWVMATVLGGAIWQSRRQ